MVDASVGSTRARVSLLPQHFPVAFPQHRRRAPVMPSRTAKLIPWVHALRMPRRLSYGELIDAILYPINDFLAVHSQLYVFLKQRTVVLRMRAGLTTEYFPGRLAAQ